MPVFSAASLDESGVACKQRVERRDAGDGRLAKFTRSATGRGLLRRQERGKRDQAEQQCRTGFEHTAKCTTENPRAQGGAALKVDWFLKVVF
jgi:hypothetical protein